MKSKALFLFMTFSLSAYAGPDLCENLVSNELGRLGLGTFNFPKGSKIQLNQDSEKFRTESSQLTQERMVASEKIRTALVKEYTKKPTESLEAYSKRLASFLAAAIARTKGQSKPDKIASGPQAEQMIRDSYAKFGNNPEKYADTLISNTLYTAPGNVEYFIDRNPQIREIDRKLALLKNQFHWDQATVHFNLRDEPFDSTVVFGSRDEFSVRVFLKGGKIRGFETVNQNSPVASNRTIRAFRLRDSDCKIVDWTKAIVDSKSGQSDDYLYNAGICSSKNPEKISKFVEKLPQVAEECKLYHQNLAVDNQSQTSAPSVSTDTPSSSGKAD
jgi:hypothetical protein